MNVKIASTEEWWDFVSNCPSATFFHTPAWYEVWKAYAGFGIEARLFELDEGKKALLPLCWKKRLKGLVRQYESGPAGTYGGFLINGRLSKQELYTLGNYIKSFDALLFRQNALNPVFEDDFWMEVDFTQMIALEAEEDVVSWSKNHRRGLKKAMQEGIDVQEAVEEQEWSDYYQVYQDSLKRWGNSATNRYRETLFFLLQKLPKDQCKLWLAKFQGKIIAGCLCFYHNRHTVYWHGAALKDYLKLRPSHLLHYEIIKDAKQNGFRWYDFNPSGGHEGVARFKQGFGAKKIAASIYHKQSPVIRKAVAFRKKLNL